MPPLSPQPICADISLPHLQPYVTPCPALHTAHYPALTITITICLTPTHKSFPCLLHPHSIIHTIFRCMYDNISLHLNMLIFPRSNIVRSSSSSVHASSRVCAVCEWGIVGVCVRMGRGWGICEKRRGVVSNHTLADCYPARSKYLVVC